MESRNFAALFSSVYLKVDRFGEYFLAQETPQNGVVVQLLRHLRLKQIQRFNLVVAHLCKKEG